MTRLALAILLATAAGTIGCDGTRPGAYSVPPAVAPPTETTTVAVILPGSGIAELDVWEADALRGEGRAKALAEVHRLAPGDPPSRQADMIAQAVASGASALIVVAEEPAAVASAIESARNDGVPVVLLDRAVPTNVTPPPPLVRYEDERASAKALVAAAREEAGKAGFPPEGPAMIVANGPGDAHARARVKALRDELKAAGVRVLPDVVFQGPRGAAKPELEAACRAAPHVAMVFAEEDQGLGAVSTFRHALDRTKRRFVMAGYTADRKLIDLVKYSTCAGQIDRNIHAPMRMAFDAVLALARGETVPGELVVPTPLLRAPGVETEGSYPTYLMNTGLMPLGGKPKENRGAPPDEAAPKSEARP